MRQVIAGLILSGFVFLLSGCGGALISTNARDLPDEVNAKISRGDTRQKVHSVMGTPWVEVPTLGVDIYYQSGRDIVVILSPVPLPIPDEKVSAAVLVSYDHEGLVDEVVSELATVYDEPCISSRGLSLIKAGTDELDTILAPPIDLETLVDISPMEGDCSLVLIMGECPMREVLVDNNQIADLGNAEGFCPWDDAPWGLYTSFLPVVRRIIIISIARLFGKI